MNVSGRFGGMGSSGNTFNSNNPIIVNGRIGFPDGTIFMNGRFRLKYVMRIVGKKGDPKGLEFITGVVIQPAVVAPPAGGGAPSTDAGNPPPK